MCKYNTISNIAKKYYCNSYYEQFNHDHDDCDLAKVRHDYILLVLKRTI